MKDFWISSETLQDHYAAEVPLVQSASELGVMRIYGKKPAPAALHKRISKGVERSKRIRAAADTVRSRPWFRGAFGPLLFIVQRPSMFRSAK